MIQIKLDYEDVIEIESPADCKRYRLTKDGYGKDWLMEE